MKSFYILTVLFGICHAQFGGFGGGRLGGIGQGLGSLSNRVSQTLSSGFKSVPLLNNVQNFDDFVSQTGRTYLNAADRTLREGLFSARKSVVDSSSQAFASGKSSYELALNAFSDFTPAEFLKKLTGNRKSSRGEQQAKKHRQPASVSPAGRVPDAFDWREKGGVTPVKFQGECGSCWSFAVTGAIEGHVFRKTGKLPNLSEQNLVDCGKEEFGLAGCDGGFQEYAFEFITTQKGIAQGAKYPYLDKKDTCKYTNQIKGAEIKGFAAVQPNDEVTMKKVIATQGPLACSVNGLESLLLYKRGIYADEECNKGEVNHSILVVGYGSENGQDYWIVKNSWGETWGEDGYFRLPRGKNFCGIASECSYPVL